MENFVKYHALYMKDLNIDPLLNKQANYLIGIVLTIFGNTTDII